MTLLMGGGLPPPNQEVNNKIMGRVIYNPSDVVRKKTFLDIHGRQYDKPVYAFSGEEAEKNKAEETGDNAGRPEQDTSGKNNEANNGEKKNK